MQGGPLLFVSSSIAGGDDKGLAVPAPAKRVSFHLE